MDDDRWIAWIEGVTGGRARVSAVRSGTTGEPVVVLEADGRVELDRERTRTLASVLAAQLLELGGAPAPTVVHDGRG